MVRPRFDFITVKEPENMYTNKNNMWDGIQTQDLSPWPSSLNSTYYKHPTWIDMLFLTIPRGIFLYFQPIKNIFSPVNGIFIFGW